MDDSDLATRVKTILGNGVAKEEISPDESFQPLFVPRIRVRSDVGIEGQPKNAASEDETFLAKLCNKLFDVTQDSDGHFERLDEVYASLSTFKVSLQPGQTIANVSREALAVLKRLPSQALGLPGLSDLAESYFDQSLTTHEEDHYSHLTQRSLLWPCLTVSTHFSTNILRMVLFREIYKQRGTPGIEEKLLVDLTSKLLRKCSELQSQDETEDSKILQRWLIVRCFLWASWQRAQMLYFYRILYFRLIHGVDTDLGSLTVLRSTPVAPGLTIQQFADEIASTGKSPYMCSWAFNLLRTDGIAIGSDFRLLHLRYNQLLGDKKGRCSKDSSEPCDGSQLGNCRRSRMKVEPQSMHDHACKGGCPRLRWDEQSYLAVTGGRAVKVSSNDATDYENRLLKYTAISDKTMAITHAWAHGQGGRPEDGLNQCLHIRYVQLAQKYECDGYFLDTACIPDEHALRKEAIKSINETFRRAKVTLIVDKDMLEVEIPQDNSQIDIELQECLLAALLVSDWNVRAWTLLESMKGRRNVYMLCKYAQCVSYRSLIQALASRGRIDIAIFVLLAPHLLSWTANSGQRDDIGMTDPTLEMAGQLLSYRPASRSGDDLVIWSLMINRTEEVPHTAEDFWHQQKGERVNTGYLVSSAKRVGKKGLTWAPKTPYAAPEDDVLPSNQPRDDIDSLNFYRAFTGEESEHAMIDERGIFAHWFVHEFNAGTVRAILEKASLKGRDFIFPREADEKNTQDELFRIKRRHLVGYHYGALARPIRTDNGEPWSMHSHIAEYSGGTNGYLLVVLGANQSESTTFEKNEREHKLFSWVWRGVHKWPVDVPLPDFQESLLWIA